MSDFETVLLSFDGYVCRIALNRPDSMNAFNRQMRLEMRQAIERANSNEEARVVVISAQGRGFCAGADLAEKLPEGQTVQQRLNEEYKPILTGIADSSKPYIASVQGVAAGIGAALALACDLVVMNQNASLYQAFSKVGLIPDGGISWHLANRLGPKRAYELIAFAKKLSAQDCLDLGLINRSVPAENLVDEVENLASGLVASAPLSLQYSKQALREVSGLSLEQAISMEANLQLHTSGSEDHAEGKRAFVEKRAPIWKGR